MSLSLSLSFCVSVSLSISLPLLPLFFLLSHPPHPVCKISSSLKCFQCTQGGKGRLWREGGRETWLGDDELGWSQWAWCPSDHAEAAVRWVDLQTQCALLKAALTVYLCDSAGRMKPQPLHTAAHNLMELQRAPLGSLVCVTVSHWPHATSLTVFPLCRAGHRSALEACVLPCEEDLWCE